MKPEQQRRANLIISMGMEATADAGDFAAIETAAHAQSVITPRLDKVGGKESLSAMLAAGHDATAIVSAMRSDALGNEVMDTLIVSGVDWNDDLTKTILSGLVSQGGAITQAVADTLIDLSITRSSPASDAGVPADTTALEFEVAWIVHAATQSTGDALTAANATRDTSIAAAQVPLDAAQATYDTAVSDANALVTPVQAKLNAVSGWLQVFEGTTAAEWQAEVDDLLASPDGNGSHGA